VLTDTAAHRADLADAVRVPPAKNSVIPMGADELLFGRGPFQAPPPRDWTSVLFYGTHLPLHGIDTIVRAAALLDGQAPIRFTIIGGGQTQQAVRSLVERLNPSDLTLRPPVPYAELPGLIREADICLGIFGTTQKAGRVVPNKIYQALMVGRPVVTRDSPAVREFFVPGENLLLCAPGDPESLAHTLLALSRDRAQQLHLAQEGRRLAHERFTSTPHRRRRALDTLARLRVGAACEGIALPGDHKVHQPGTLPSVTCPPRHWPLIAGRRAHCGRKQHRTRVPFTVPHQRYHRSSGRRVCALVNARKRRKQPLSSQAMMVITKTASTT
jgi:hypothetical protein